jgi:DNA polymerase III delta subunit
LTDEIVDEVVYPDSEYKIYELSNAVSRKNYGEYVKIMNELSAKGFDETALLATLAAHFKGVYEVSIMKGSDAEIAAALGLREFAVKKNREQAKSFGRERLAYLYESVFEAISGFKCGELTQNAALKLVTAKIFF